MSCEISRGKMAACAILSLAGVVLPLAAQAVSYPARPVFAPDSFWYEPIPADAPLNADSTAYVAEFLRQYHAYYHTVGNQHDRL